MEKQCCACKKFKEYGEFGKDKRTPVGLKSRCRECERIYMRKYKEENRDRLNEYMRGFYKKNAPRLLDRRRELYKGERRKKCLTYNKAYRDEHKERRAEYMRQKRVENPEHHKEISKRSYYKHKTKRNKEGRNAYRVNAEDRKRKAKEYRQKNKDRVLKWNRERRARQADIPGSHTIEQWEELCSFFKGVCPRCSKKRKLTVDHIIPITHPKSTDCITNIQPLCRSCNSSKNSTEIVDYRSEWIKTWAQTQKEQLIDESPFNRR